MRRTRTQPFAINDAIPQAWDLLWRSNLEQRKEDEKSEHVYRKGSTYYLTASDVENQVRQFAQDQANGKPWGTSGRAWGRGYGLSVRLSGGQRLQSKVRDWLLNEVRLGRLASHNFGRGHISGMRFRPKGEPLAPAEQRTIEVKEKRKDKPKRLHLYSDGYCSRALCLKNRKRSPWGRGRSSAWCTNDKAKVTCPSCIKLGKDHKPKKMVAEEVA